MKTDQFDVEILDKLKQHVTVVEIKITFKFSLKHFVVHFCYKTHTQKITDLDVLILWCCYGTFICLYFAHTHI